MSHTSSSLGHGFLHCSDDREARYTATEEREIADKQHAGGAGLQVSSASVASVAESGGPPPAPAPAPAVGNEKQDAHLQYILKKVSSCGAHPSRRPSCRLPKPSACACCRPSAHRSLTPNWRALQAHGWCMFSGFIVLLPAGILAANLFSRTHARQPWWFYMHATLTGAGSFLASVGSPWGWFWSSPTSSP